MSRLAVDNLWLADRVADRYIRNGYPPAASKSAAQVCLLKVLWDWDPDRRPLGPYLGWRLPRAVARTLRDELYATRIPERAVHDSIRLDQTAASFELEHDRRPTAAELTELTGLSLSRVRELVLLYDLTSRPADLADTAPVADTEPSPEDTAITTARISMLRRVAHSFDPDSRALIVDLFGLDSGQVLLAREVASRHGVSERRVRSARDEFVAALQHPSKQSLRTG